MDQDKTFDTIVIGGGQAGLAMGHYLARQGRDFTILDGQERVGDVWRKRWDSLRLFTPAEYSSLPGMPFPTASEHLPTKDEMADYLETYARHFELPIQLKTWVKRLTRNEQGYLLETNQGRFQANHVIIATGAFQKQRRPPFAADLSPTIKQLPSSDYRNSQQLAEGDVLVVGAGNSGSEIAMDIARSPFPGRVWLAGRDTGSMKRRILGKDIFWWLWRTLFKIPVHTRIGQRLKHKLTTQGAARPGVSLEDIEGTGVNLALQKVERVRDGKPALADGTVLEAATVIWATGYQPDFSWIDLPVIGADGYPEHERGVATAAPGLYFIGLPFLYRGNSSLVGGVGADAAYLVEQIPAAVRQQTPQTVPVLS